MPLGRQAKIVTDKQVRAILAELDSRRYPLRDRVMFLLSMKSGLRAHEIASVTWGMVTDAEGQIADVIALENRATKGKSGRIIPMHPDLKAALTALKRSRSEKACQELPVIFSERDRGLSAGGRGRLVLPALPRPWNDRLLVALWAPDFHNPCGPKN
jgi:integrase/recombinase XerD